ncbi:MAG: hypothetical protein MI923_12580 [Phycisphaerales bacterium]|nr:hypothetical protein [Phycisphaerales bacterium]
MTFKRVHRRPMTKTLARNPRTTLSDDFPPTTTSSAERQGESPPNRSNYHETVFTDGDRS